MIDKLKARKAELARLREERGATDPILIIAGIAITLILLVGGSFAISGFIGNANNLNARGDLDRIATAQAAYLAQNDNFATLAVGPNVATKNTQLQSGALGFTPTANNSTIVRTSPTGWTAVTKSASGALFARTSQSSEVFEIEGKTSPAPTAYSAWSEETRNLIRNPSFENDLVGVGYNRVAGSRTGEGAVEGNSALALTRTSDASVDAYADILNMVEGGRGGTGATSLKPDTTYTITATYTLTEPLSSAPAGATTNLGQKLSIFVHLNGTQRLTLEGKNSPGTQTLTGTFTTPSTFAGYNTMRLYAGDSANTPSRVRWDAVGLYEGDTRSVGYYDGSSTAPNTLTRFRWLGTAGNSLSVMDTRTKLPAGAPIWTPTEQPSRLLLPAGITWDDMASDLQDVYS
jgi:hypothetical protein